MGSAGTVWELPISRRLQGPTITLMYGSLSQRADAHALELETLPGRGPAGAYRAARTLGITGYNLFFFLLNPLYDFG